MIARRVACPLSPPGTRAIGGKRPLLRGSVERVSSRRPLGSPPSTDGRRFVVDLAIATTLFALFMLGFGIVRLFLVPGAPLSGLAGSAVVMVLTTLVSFALGFGMNFFATLPKQRLGPVEITWTVTAMVVGLGGSRLLARKAAPLLREVDGNGPRPISAGGVPSKDASPKKVSRAA
jgi:hypothetical protein